MNGRPWPSIGARRIMVVDDSGKIRAVIRQQLEAAGYTVTEADGVDAALILMGERQPLVLITDIQMSGL